ncbi:hypothetical protein N431DRAFT_508502 [Stipitochalara longipes BDJ]|nr:hypothetical protein N431DRAFT_508502 [Stipitochalara longipes BDJ]
MKISSLLAPACACTTRLLGALAHHEAFIYQESSSLFDCSLVNSFHLKPARYQSTSHFVTCGIRPRMVKSFRSPYNYTWLLPPK